MAKLRASRAAGSSSNVNTNPSKRGTFGTEDSDADEVGDNMGLSSRGGKGKASAGGVGVDSDEEEDEGRLVGAKRSRSDYDEVWE